MPTVRSLFLDGEPLIYLDLIQHLPRAAGPRDFNALHGRVGTGRPFPIGSQQTPIRMPGSGSLQLGINDDFFPDNSGAFSVTVQVNGRPELPAGTWRKLRVWLNDRLAYRRDETAAPPSVPDRFDCNLATGRNRLVVEVAAGAPPLLFSLRRAVDLAALRAGDFFCALVFAAARAAGFLDFFVAMELSLVSFP